MPLENSYGCSVLGIARGRLAPSPTGQMHLGNAFAFAMASCSVRSKKGQLVLRMEDIDPNRSKPEFVRQIYNDLAWLAIAHDEGPDIGGPFPPYQQSECQARYKRALRHFEALGVVYPCFCTRKELRSMASAPHNEDGSTVYPGTCRHYTHDEQKQLRSAGHVSCIRLDVAKALSLVACTPDTPDTPGLGPHDPDGGRRDKDPSKCSFGAGLLWDETKNEPCHGMLASARSSAGNETKRAAFVTLGAEVANNLLASGDFALMRSDGVVAYQLAVVADDIAMEITEVVRGNDLRGSMARQTLLFYLLGADPPQFLHVPLLCDSGGERLAKRHQSLSLAELQGQGVSAEAVMGFLGWLAGFFSDLQPRAMHELVACWSAKVAEQEKLILPENSITLLKNLSR